LFQVIVVAGAAAVGITGGGGAALDGSASGDFKGVRLNPLW